MSTKHNFAKTQQEHILRKPESPCCWALPAPVKGTSILVVQVALAPDCVKENHQWVLLFAVPVSLDNVQS